MGAKEIRWLAQPEDHNYPAAVSYLSLLYSPTKATGLVKKLRRARISHFKAKDILRASSLTLLGIRNAHVERDQGKIDSGIALSPVLLVRDAAHARVIIADGYHRLCAVYWHNENALIPCKIT
jgi:hypothetical protein